LFSPRRIKVNFVQFFSFEQEGRSPPPMGIGKPHAGKEKNMQRLSVKLASTAAIAALLKSSSIALLWLGIAGGPAAAQQPSSAQVSAIRAACRADYKANCASVQPGGPAALACLKKNLAALSPECQKAVGAVGGAATPAKT
jgi:Cysteine rich repeat